VFKPAEVRRIQQTSSRPFSICGKNPAGSSLPLARPTVKQQHRMQGWTEESPREGILVISISTKINRTLQMMSSACCLLVGRCVSDGSRVLVNCYFSRQLSGWCFQKSYRRYKTFTGEPDHEAKNGRSRVGIRRSSSSVTSQQQ